MAGQKSDYFANAILTYIEAGTALTSLTATNGAHIALYTTALDSTDTDATAGEVDTTAGTGDDGNYVRVAIDATKWDITGTNPHMLSPSEEIPLYTADTDGRTASYTILSWAIVDTASGAGNILYWCDTPNLTVEHGNEVKINNDGVSITEN